MVLIHFRDYNGNGLCGRWVLLSTLAKERVTCSMCLHFLKEKEATP